MLILTLLQSLSIATEPGLRASKETLLEHREQLIALIKATRVLQGTPDAPVEASKPRLSPRKRLIYETVWLLRKAYHRYGRHATRSHRFSVITNFE